MSTPTRARGDRWAVRWLVVAMAIAAVTILYLGRDLSFISDELGWLTAGDDLAPSTLLTPHNGHLIAIPRLVYEVLPQLFGTAYLPFRLVALAAFGSCVGLFFVLARREIGGIALAPSVILLFFGSAAVIVLSPLAIPFTFSIGFALAAVAILDSGHRHSKALACVLLVLSLLSHSFGGIVAAGLVVFLSLDGQGRRDLWVPLVPIALYAVWWLWALKFDEGVASASNLAEVPAFVVESAVATLAAVTGFAGPTTGDGLGFVADLAEVAAVTAAAAAALWLFWQRRHRAPSPWLWPFLFILVAFWVLLGLSEGPTREPTTPRFLFFGSVMLLLLVAARGRGARLSQPALAAVLAASAVALALNFSHLVRVADASSTDAVEVRAQLGALELAGAAARPDFTPRIAGPPASKDIAVEAGPYLAFVDEHGGLGFSSAELERQPGAVQAGADLVLARAVGLGALPSELSFQRCEQVPATLSAPARFELPASRVTLLRLAEAGPAQELLVGRFTAPSVIIGSVSSDGFAAVEPPPDAYPGPWIGQLGASVDVCPPGEQP